jgi:hypothetical protein
MDYKTQAGMRMVDYEYPDVNGNFEISYLIAPGQVNPAAINLLFDKLAESFVKTLQGSKVTQSSISLQSFPGRQLNVEELKGKPGAIAHLRMYSVRRFVYIVGVIGKKDWVSSPIAKDFMSSFSFTPELTKEEKGQQERAQAQQRRQAFDDSFQRRQQEFNERFQRSQSDARKAQERARVDFETHRTSW